MQNADSRTATKAGLNTMLALVAAGVDPHVARSETLLNLDRLESGEAPDAVAAAIREGLPEHLRTQRPPNALDALAERARRNTQQQAGDKAAQHIAKKREAAAKVPNPISTERKRK